jgi:hypothetical protein
MYSDIEANRRIMERYQYDRENLGKPLKDRAPPPWLDNKKGYAARYPELADESYIEEMKQYLPKVALTETQKKQEAMREQSLSSNQNVQMERIESLLEHSKHRQQSLLDE